MRADAVLLLDAGHRPGLLDAALRVFVVGACELMRTCSSTRR
jgi:hypothetical protein